MIHFKNAVPTCNCLIYGHRGLFHFSSRCRTHFVRALFVTADVLAPMVDAEMSKRLNLISGGGNLTDAHAQIRALKKNKRWCLELCGFVVVPSALLIVILSTLYHQHTTVSTGGPATAADAVSIGNTWSSTSLSPAAEADPVDSAGKKIMFPKIVLLGDSLVSRSFSRDMGWGAMVADRFKRKVDVVVRGFSGYTSGMLKDTMPLILHTFIGQPIAAVVVLIGTYDVVAALDKQNIQAYEENLVEIVFSIQVISSSA